MYAPQESQQRHNMGKSRNGKTIPLMKQISIILMFACMGGRGGEFRQRRLGRPLAEAFSQKRIEKKRSFL